MQMPLDSNIPYEWQVGSENGKLAIILPSWSQTDKTSVLVMMDKTTRELWCECKGFQMRRDCHHIRGLVWFCHKPLRRKGVQRTSLEAWRMLQETLGDHQRKVLKALRELGRASNKQISSALGWPINTITPRVKELRDMGLIDYAGEQYDNRTQRHEIVWSVA